MFALVFGAAALAGGAVERDTAKPEHAGGEEMEMSAAPAGLAIAARGYPARACPQEVPQEERQPLAFGILADEARSVRAFDASLGADGSSTGSAGLLQRLHQQRRTRRRPCPLARKLQHCRRHSALGGLPPISRL